MLTESSLQFSGLMRKNWNECLRADILDWMEPFFSPELCTLARFLGRYKKTSEMGWKLVKPQRSASLAEFCRMLYYSHGKRFLLLRKDIGMANRYRGWKVLHKFWNNSSRKIWVRALVKREGEQVLPIEFISLDEKSQDQKVGEGEETEGSSTPVVTRSCFMTPKP